MRLERQAPQQAGPIGKVAAWWALNSAVNYSLFCPVCGIPTQGDLCRTCHAWGLLGKHIELAARCLREL
jgi:hypothetical protein